LVPAEQGLSCSSATDARFTTLPSFRSVFGRAAAVAASARPFCAEHAYDRPQSISSFPVRKTGNEAEQVLCSIRPPHLLNLSLSSSSHDNTPVRMHSSLQIISKTHRESISLRLSVDTSYLMKELCISIAACVTHPCTGDFEATSKQIMRVIMTAGIMICHRNDHAAFIMIVVRAVSSKIWILRIIMFQLESRDVFISATSTQYYQSGLLTKQSDFNWSQLRTVKQLQLLGVVFPEILTTKDQRVVIARLSQHNTLRSI